MPKLTDEEVGQLLRETFTEKEQLLDQLPEATTRPGRRKLPVLLAAASVLAVLGGAVSSVGIDHRQEDEPGGRTHVASRPQSQAVEVSLNLSTLGSGLAIKEAATWERPAAGWPVVKIVEAPYAAAASPTSAGVAGRVFSDEDKKEIEASAGLPIEWVKSLPKGPPGVCPSSDGTPYVTVGPLVRAKKDSSYTIGVSLWRGCTDARWVTYRLAEVRNAKGGSDWRITGTVGPEAIS